MEGNSANFNAQSGVFVQGRGNFIVRNSASHNRVGFAIDGSGNLIICNLATQNGPGSDFQVGGSQSMGPILKTPLPSSPVDLGNVGTSPWANFIL
jgi:parallel beta-helix repeat protein